MWMPAVDKLVIPPELKGKVSPALVEMAQARIGVWVFTMTLAMMFSLNLPLLIWSVHHGYLYLLGPGACPFVVAALFSFVPTHPYRGIVWATKVRPINASDSVAVRLAELYKSGEVQRHLWRQAAKFSGLLLAITLALAIIAPSCPAWLVPFFHPGRPLPTSGLDKTSYVVNLLLVSLSAYLVLGVELNAWCLETWVAQETKPRQAKET